MHAIINKNIYNIILKDLSKLIESLIKSNIKNPNPSKICANQKWFTEKISIICHKQTL